MHELNVWYITEHRNDDAIPIWADVMNIRSIWDIYWDISLDIIYIRAIRGIQTYEIGDMRWITPKKDILRQHQSQCVGPNIRGLIMKLEYRKNTILQAQLRTSTPANDVRIINKPFWKLLRLNQSILFLSNERHSYSESFSFLILAIRRKLSIIFSSFVCDSWGKTRKS